MAENITGYDAGTVLLPYHSDVYLNWDFYQNNENYLFPWEGPAMVASAEHSSLHPLKWVGLAREYEYFSQHWLGDTVGIFHTMSNAAREDFHYATPNEAALGSRYAEARQDPSSPIYAEFYGLAFLTFQMGVHVYQPYQYFSHQDRNQIRGQGPDLNNTLYTETVAFGPNWYELKTFTVSAMYLWVDVGN